MCIKLTVFALLITLILLGAVAHGQAKTKPAAADVVGKLDNLLYLVANASSFTDFFGYCKADVDWWNSHDVSFCQNKPTDGDAQCKDTLRPSEAKPCCFDGIWRNSKPGCPWCMQGEPEFQNTTLCTWCSESESEDLNATAFLERHCTVPSSWERPVGLCGVQANGTGDIPTFPIVNIEPVPKDNCAASGEITIFDQDTFKCFDDTAVGEGILDRLWGRAPSSKTFFDLQVTRIWTLMASVGGVNGTVTQSGQVNIMGSNRTNDPNHNDYNPSSCTRDNLLLMHTTKNGGQARVNMSSIDTLILRKVSNYALPDGNVSFEVLGGSVIGLDIDNWGIVSLDTVLPIHFSKVRNYAGAKLMATAGSTVFVANVQNWGAVELNEPAAFSVYGVTNNGALTIRGGESYIFNTVTSGTVSLLNGARVTVSNVTVSGGTISLASGGTLNAQDLVVAAQAAATVTSAASVQLIGGDNAGALVASVAQTQAVAIVTRDFVNRGRVTITATTSGATITNMHNVGGGVLAFVSCGAVAGTNITNSGSADLQVGTGTTVSGGRNTGLLTLRMCSGAAQLTVSDMSNAGEASVNGGSAALTLTSLMNEASGNVSVTTCGVATATNLRNSGKAVLSVGVGSSLVGGSNSGSLELKICSAAGSSPARRQAGSVLTVRGFTLEGTGTIALNVPAGSAVELDVNILGNATLSIAACGGNVSGVVKGDSSASLNVTCGSVNIDVAGVSTSFGVLATGSVRYNATTNATDLSAPCGSVQDSSGGGISVTNTQSCPSESSAAASKSFEATIVGFLYLLYILV